MRGGPLTAVLAAFEEGAHSLAEVAQRCDLPLDTVRAAVDHLVRLGRLEARELPIGCPPSGCGSCAHSVPRSGPVLVAISVARQPCTSCTAPTRAAVRTARSSSVVT